MKISNIITEANVASKIKDPRTVKMLAIAMRNDPTIPKSKIAALGPRPSDQDMLDLWSELLDDSLRQTNYGDMSEHGKFDQWLTRLYISGTADYEDINGEGGDALGAWKALSVRNRLQPAHQDFNKFKTLRQIQNIVEMYSHELMKIRDAEEIETHKREKKELVLIDNDRFLVFVPFNYGSCYTFNNSAGYQASFCTGSSSGLQWFNHEYAPRGPVISILDKSNIDDVNGKWQMHGPSGQMNNGNQSLKYERGDRTFAELFPGLLKKIADAMRSKSAEIKAGSKEHTPGGYDVEKAINDIKQNLPHSWASEAKNSDQNQDENTQNSIFIVTLLSDGTEARIQASSEDDAFAQVQARHPNITRDQLSIQRA